MKIYPIQEGELPQAEGTPGHAGGQGKDGTLAPPLFDLEAGLARGGAGTEGAGLVKGGGDPSGPVFAPLPDVRPGRLPALPQNLKNGPDCGPVLSPKGKSRRGSQSPALPVFNLLAGSPTPAIQLSRSPRADVSDGDDDTNLLDDPVWGAGIDRTSAGVESGRRRSSRRSGSSTVNRVSNTDQNSSNENASTTQNVDVLLPTSFTDLSSTATAKVLGSMMAENQRQESPKHQAHQRDLLTTIFGRSESTYVRAFAATLLAIAETIPGPGFVEGTLIPGAELAVSVAQLSMFDHMIVPLFVPQTPAFIYTLNKLLLFRPPIGGRLMPSDFAIATFVVLLSWTLILLLVVLYRFRSTVPSLIPRTVASYLRLATGVFFIPVTEALTQCLAELVMHDRPTRDIIGRGLVSLVMAIIWVPFTLVITQNKLDSDENSNSVTSRRHNRTDLIFVPMKLLLTLAGNSRQPLLKACVSIFLFPTFLAAHSCTHIYWRERINRLLDGAYAVLLLGAVAQLIIEAHDVAFGVDDLSGSMQLIFWISILPTFYAAYRYDSLALAQTRHRLNEWLVSRLSMFDFADNAQLIERFNLADELHSATRMGKYAQYLATSNKFVAAVAMFNKALTMDPNHPDNLGNYAELLVQMGKHKLAPELFERALRRNSHHRRNLESYAYFLSGQSDDGALYFFQRSLLTYFKHLRFRDVYVNSSDATLLVSSTGDVLDCNGAALVMFHCRRRADLCGGTQLLDLMYGRDRDALTKVLHLLAGNESTGTEVRSQRLKGEMLVRDTTQATGKRIISVILCATRVQHRHQLVHVSIVDVTELREQAREMNVQTFQKAASPMIMIDQRGLIQHFNEAAVEFFGYQEMEVVGGNITMLMPVGFKNTHDSYIQRYIRTGEKRLIGTIRNVDVVLRGGQTRLCALKVNELKMQDQTFFIGILHDVTKATEALSLAESCFGEASTPMVVLNNKGVVTRWNTCAATTFEYAPDQAVGKDLSFLFPPQEAAQTFIERYTAMGDKSPLSPASTIKQRAELGHTTDMRLLTATGTPLICTVKINKFMSGQQAMYVCLLHDVTSFVVATEFVNGVFDVAASPHIVINQREIIVQYNKAAEDAFGYSKEEMIGCNVAKLMSEEHSVRHHGYVQHYLQSGIKRMMGLRRRVPVRTKDGLELRCILELSELVLNTTQEHFFVGILTVVESPRAGHRPMLAMRPRASFNAKPTTPPPTEAADGERKRRFSR